MFFPSQRLRYFYRLCISRYSILFPWQYDNLTTHIGQCVTRYIGHAYDSNPNHPAGNPRLDHGIGFRTARHSEEIVSFQTGLCSLQTSPVRSSP